MKKYVDYSPLLDSCVKHVDEESKSIRINKIVTAIFIVISLVMIGVSVVFNSVELILISILPLYLTVASIGFYKMHVGFKNDWIKMNEDNNKTWINKENKNNKDWDKFFEDWRKKGCSDEKTIVENENDVIESSIKSVIKSADKLQ